MFCAMSVAPPAPADYSSKQIFEQRVMNYILVEARGRLVRWLAQSMAISAGWEMYIIRLSRSFSGRDEYVSASLLALGLLLGLLCRLDHHCPSDTLALCRGNRKISNNGRTRIPSVARCSTNPMCVCGGFDETSIISPPIFLPIVSCRLS